MKATTERGITTILIKINVLKLPTGHRAQRSGAGKHADKRTKRGRTRDAAFRKAVSE